MGLHCASVCLNACRLQGQCCVCSCLPVTGSTIRLGAVAACAASKQKTYALFVQSQTARKDFYCCSHLLPIASKYTQVCSQNISCVCHLFLLDVLCIVLLTCPYPHEWGDDDGTKVRRASQACAHHLIRLIASHSNAHLLLYICRYW